MILTRQRIFNSAQLYLAGAIFAGCSAVSIDAMAGGEGLFGKGTSWMFERYALYDIDACGAKEMATVLVTMVMLVAMTLVK